MIATIAYGMFKTALCLGLFMVGVTVLYVFVKRVKGDR